MASARLLSLEIRNRHSLPFADRSRYRSNLAVSSPSSPSSQSFTPSLYSGPSLPMGLSWQRAQGPRKIFNFILDNRTRRCFQMEMMSVEKKKWEIRSDADSQRDFPFSYWLSTTETDSHFAICMFDNFNLILDYGILF